VQTLPYPSRLGTLVHSAGDVRPGRIVAARIAVLGGVVAYNWWVLVPFVPGLMPSVNGFFSDLEATGRPYASDMAHADLLAGILMFGALTLRGPLVAGSVRREWKWMVAFAVAGALGGRCTYACAEGLSAACRSMEWHLRLPAHHYVHVVSGIAEFATLTVAGALAARRTHGQTTAAARLYARIWTALLVGYPFLAASYLLDKLGTLVEPYFFVLFSVMVLAEVFEGLGSPTGTPLRAQRVFARSDRPVGDEHAGGAEIEVDRGASRSATGRSPDIRSAGHPGTA